MAQVSNFYPPLVSSSLAFRFGMVLSRSTLSKMALASFSWKLSLAWCGHAPHAGVHARNCRKTEPKTNRPRSIYQCPNMAPRLSGQTSIFGVIFFVSKSHLGIEGQKNLQFWPESLGAMLKKLRYRKWPIAETPGLFSAYQLFLSYLNLFTT